jgi:hypothetical protein
MKKHSVRAWRANSWHEFASRHFFSPSHSASPNGLSALSHSRIVLSRLLLNSLVPEHRSSRFTQISSYCMMPPPSDTHSLQRCCSRHSHSVTHLTIASQCMTIQCMSLVLYMLGRFAWVPHYELSLMTHTLYNDSYCYLRHV